MPKMGAKRTGPEDPWAIHPDSSGTGTGSFVYTAAQEIMEIEWNDGTTQVFGGDVSVYPTPGTRPNLNAGMLFAVFVLKGDTQTWCTTIDNAVLDTLVGAATWAVIGWLDADAVHDWQQY